jgi:hypothetical protein
VSLGEPAESVTFLRVASAGGSDADPLRRDKALSAQSRDRGRDLVIGAPAVTFAHNPVLILSEISSIVFAATHDDQGMWHCAVEIVCFCISICVETKSLCSAEHGFQENQAEMIRGSDRIGSIQKNPAFLQYVSGNLTVGEGFLSNSVCALQRANEQ